MENLCDLQNLERLQRTCRAFGAELRLVQDDGTRRQDRDSPNCGESMILFSFGPHVTHPPFLPRLGRSASMIMMKLRRSSVQDSRCRKSLDLGGYAPSIRVFHTTTECAKAGADIAGTFP